MKKLLLVLGLSLGLVGNNVRASETIYYCSMQNFVGALPDNSKDYHTSRFTMKISRENSNSNDGRVSFSDGHPFDISFNVWGFRVGYLQSSSGASAFGFHLSDGQMFQAWTTPYSSAAFSAKCEKF